MSFSGALRLTDLNDFIGPSQDCIKPIEIPKNTVKRGKIKLDGAVNVSQSKPVISLTDCLACSGCVTSAETILIESQSAETLFKFMKEHRDSHVFVTTVSPQTISSLANKLGKSYILFIT